MSIALGAGLIAVTGYRVLLIAMTGTMSIAAAYLLTRAEQRRGQATTKLGEAVTQRAHVTAQNSN
jgi:hypothetical protein